MKDLSCVIGITLLIASLSSVFVRRDSEEFKRFYNLLDAGQKNKYESIVKERLMIYLGGMVLGSIISYIYYHQNKNTKHLFCKLLVIGYLVKLGFYYLFPKSPLMIYSLYSKDQTDAWADIYSEMKNRWIHSIFVGFFAYVFLTYALLK